MSVVIATRNRRGELCRTLRELAGLPVIVVDNASADGTAETVRRDFPDVDLVRLPVNRGAAARNAGVLRAGTPYVAFSDDDSWWAPGALNTAADTLDRYPRLGLIAAAVDVGEDPHPDPVNHALAHGLPPHTNRPEPGTSRPGPLAHDLPPHADPLGPATPRPGPPGASPRSDLPGPRVLGFLGCAAVVRREAFWAVRGFSGALFFGAEETLLAYDLAAAGWDLCHLPEVRARHVPSEHRPPAAWRTAMERRNGLLIAALRRPWRVAASHAYGLARDALHDPASRHALRGTLRALPLLRHRSRLPTRIEADIEHLARGVEGTESTDRGASTPAPERGTPGPSPEPSPEPGPRPELGPGPEPSPTPEPGQRPEPSPEPEPGQRPGPSPEPGPRPELGPRPEPSPTPEPGQRPEPSPEPGPGSGSRVAVVMITRNRRAELEDVLGRMAGQAPLIVVDNGSTDGTPELVASRFPRTGLVRAGANLGAAARNLAVRHVTTPYVAFCDDDTWWEPGALDRAADHLDAHPALAAVTGRILVEPGGRADPITPELRDSPVPGPPWLPGPALLSLLAGATMMRVDAFRRAGGFSPRLWLGGEEELLGLDLAARGWWMCWAPDVIVHHRPSRSRDPRGRRRLGIRNTLWTAWLRRRPPGALRHTAAVLRAVPRDRTSLAAVTDAVRGLPWVLRERRPVPRHVEHAARLLDAPRRRSRARRYVG